MGIQKALGPERQRFKADHLFFLLPTLSFEGLVLKLIFYCFGRTGSSSNPFWEGGSFHPYHGPHTYHSPNYSMHHPQSFPRGSSCPLGSNTTGRLTQSMVDVDRGRRQSMLLDPE